MGTGREVDMGTGRRLGRRLAVASLSASLLFGSVATGVAALSPLAPRAMAQEDTGAGTSYVAVQALNVRAQPTISAAVMGTLGYGAVVTVVGGPVAADGYTWFQLARDGQTLGWSVNGIVAGPPPGTGGTPAPIGEFEAGDTVSVNVNALNVRQTPSTAAAIVDVLVSGERVTLTGGGQVVGSDVWYPIAGGWIAGQFLTAATVTPPTTPPTTPPPSGGFAYGQSVTVTAGLLNGRSTPSLSGGIITVFTSGQTLTITSEPRQADGITWYGVNDTAWVSGQYLAAGGTSGGTTPPPATGGTSYPVTVTTDVLNLRSGPSLSATVITAHARGTTLTVTGAAVRADGIDWLPVNGAGWVAGSLVQRVGEGEGVGQGVPVYTVVVDVANLRAGPGTDTAIVGTSTFGQSVLGYTTRADSSGRQWLLITDGGNTWIAADLVAPKR